MSAASFEVRFLDLEAARVESRTFGGVITSLPGRPELLPALHLLNTSLASVFFQSLGT